VMYGKSFPVVALEADDFASLVTGAHVIVDRVGRVCVS